MTELNFFSSAKKRSSEGRIARLSRCNQDCVPKSFDRFGFDYYDNPNTGCGYGGYSYDGRYAETAQNIIDHYQLKYGDRVLEVGCAKGYLLVEFEKLGMDVCGIEISEYAIQNAHPRIRDRLIMANAANLPLNSSSFDLVVSKEVLPHLTEIDIELSLAEFKRVAKSANIFLEIQCAVSEAARALCLKWDRTHKTIKTPQWWRNKMDEVYYPGDYYLKELFVE